MDSNQLLELIEKYQSIIGYQHGAKFHTNFMSDYAHLVLLLDLSPSLLEFEKIGNECDFKFKFMIKALKTLFQQVQNCLITIFILYKDQFALDIVLIYLRNHLLTPQNVDLICECTINFILNVYRSCTKLKEVNLTLQQAISQTLNQLRYQDQRYMFKKFIVFSDFANFGYDSFSYFIQSDDINNIIIWDTQGYAFSLNGVYLANQNLNKFGNCRNVSDFKLIKSFMKAQNGNLFDINLLDDKKREFQLFSIPLKISYTETESDYGFQNILEFGQIQRKDARQNKLFKFIRLDSYQINYQYQFIKMRILEGFKLVCYFAKLPNFVCCLKFNLNFSTSLIYLIIGDQVQILIKFDHFKTQLSLLSKELEKIDQKLWQSNLQALKQQIHQKDHLQLIIYQMRVKNNLDDTFAQLVSMKAFENQRFVNRNFGQISLMFVISNIDFRQYQDQSENSKEQSLYTYIRNKIKSVANKSIGNCLLYMDENRAFVVVRVVWPAHGLLRLICIFDNQSLVKKIEDKVQQVIKEDSILNGTLIQFDKSLKNLLASHGDQGELRRNNEYYHLAEKWEWKKSYIWKLEEMYRIIVSMRVKLGFIRVPSSGGQYNKFYVQQYNHQEKPIVMVQHLYYDQKDQKLCVKVFTENIMDVDHNGKAIRTKILEYFNSIKQQELLFIKMLYTHHVAYRQSLMKKQNSNLLDYFVLNTMDSSMLKQKGIRAKISVEETLKKFRDFATREIKQYESPTEQEMLDFNLVLQKSYKYASFNYYLGNNEQLNNLLIEEYKKILQTISDYSVYQPIDMIFKYIGEKKLLCITIQEEQNENLVLFRLIGLDYIEKNLNVSQFLNSQAQRVTDNLIKYVEHEFQLIYSKKLHILCNQNVYVPQMHLALHGCEVQNQDIDLTDVYNSLRILFDPSLKFTSAKSIAKSTPLSAKSMVDESPAKPKQSKRDSTKPQKFMLWNVIAEQVNSKFLNDLSVYVRKIPQTEIYYFIKNEEKELGKGFKKFEHNVLFLKLQCIDSEGEKKFDNFASAIISNDLTKLDSKNKEKHILQLSYYYAENLNLLSMIQGDYEFEDKENLFKQNTGKSSSPLDVGGQLRLNKQMELIKRQIQQLILYTNLQIKRLIVVNDDTFRGTQSQIEQCAQREQKILITRNYFQNIKFQNQFYIELISQSSLTNLFSFVIADDCFVFKLTYDNCNHTLLDGFQQEKEMITLCEHQYVVPFWLYVRFNVNTIEAIWIPPEQDIQELIFQLESLILQAAKTTHQFIFVEECRDKQDTSILLLEPYFKDSPILERPDLQEKNSEELPQKTNPILGALRRQQKKQTVVNKKEIQKLEIPFVGWRIFFMYHGYRGDLIRKLLRKTILFNNYSQSSGVTYFGIYEKQTYIFVFQEIKNTQQYEELNVEEIIKKREKTSNVVIMNCYCPSKDTKQTQLAIDYFYAHILKQQEDEVVSTMASTISKNPRLDKDDYLYITENGEILNFEIPIQCKELSIFLTLLKQNMERVFVKYELYNRDPKSKDPKESKTDNDLAAYLFDNYENSFVYSSYKFVNQKIKLSQVFGDAIAIIFIRFLDQNQNVIQMRDDKKSNKKQSFAATEKDENSPRAESELQDIPNEPKLPQSQATCIQFQFKKKGQMNKTQLEEYLKVLIKQVLLEYEVEYLLSGKQLTQENIMFTLQQIKELCMKLENFSFHLHQLRYPIYYSQSSWKELLLWIQQEIQQELKKRIQIESLNQFELILQDNQIMESINEIQFKKDQFGYHQIQYVISDQLNYEKDESLDLAKNQNYKRQKDQDYVIQRSLLFYLIISNNQIEVFAYNINWELLANINQMLQKLSKWSIIRFQIAQKMQNELLGVQQIQQQLNYEETFLKRHIIYQQSFINDLHKITKLEPQQKEEQGRFQKLLSVMDQKMQQQALIFKTTSSCIEYIVSSKFPDLDVQISKAIQEHIIEFYRIPFLGTKSNLAKQLYITSDREFLEQFGRLYLKQQKEDFIKLVSQFKSKMNETSLIQNEVDIVTNVIKETEQEWQSYQLGQ